MISKILITQIFKRSNPDSYAQIPAQRASFFQRLAPLEIMSYQNSAGMESYESIPTEFYGERDEHNHVPRLRECVLYKHRFAGGIQTVDS
jgi:hypothetical protein